MMAKKLFQIFSWTSRSRCPPYYLFLMKDAQFCVIYLFTLKKMPYVEGSAKCTKYWNQSPSYMYLTVFKKLSCITGLNMTG